MFFILPIIVAFFASILTFFSGFGIGTIMLPVFALFFPLELAIVMTGIVHFLNNLFKAIISGKSFDRKITLKLGIPGIIGAFLGSWILIQLSMSSLSFSYSLLDCQFETTIFKLIIGMLLILFVLLEMYPRFKNWNFSENQVYFIGFLSGLFGGISGHQGVLRTAVLSKLKLEKEVFIATGIVIACMVDISRMSVYFSNFHILTRENVTLLAFTILSAFLGAYIGSKLLKKVTMNIVQNIVFLMLILVGTGMCLGIV